MHHLKRAKKVYEDRGVIYLFESTFSYIFIELNNLIF